MTKRVVLETCTCRSKTYLETELVDSGEQRERERERERDRDREDGLKNI